ATSHLPGLLSHGAAPVLGRDTLHPALHRSCRRGDDGYIRELSDGKGAPRGYHCPTSMFERSPTVREASSPTVWPPGMVTTPEEMVPPLPSAVSIYGFSYTSMAVPEMSIVQSETESES